MLDPETGMQLPQKVPVIGSRMRKAWAIVERHPGYSATVLAREVGKPCVDRLINAGICKQEGDKLYALTLARFIDTQPDASYQLKRTDQGHSRDEIVAHNILSVQCPICESAVGKLCRSTKDNRQVRFPHYKRINECIYMLSILATLDDRETK